MKTLVLVNTKVQGSNPCSVSGLFLARFWAWGGRKVVEAPRHGLCLNGGRSFGAERARAEALVEVVVSVVDAAAGFRGKVGERAVDVPPSCICSMVGDSRAGDRGRAVAVARVVVAVVDAAAGYRGKPFAPSYLTRKSRLFRPIRSSR